MGHQEEGERGGEGGARGRGGRSETKSCSPSKRKKRRRDVFGKSKDLHLSGGKKINQLVFFVQAPGRCEANQQPQRPQRKYCQAHDVASPICPTHHACNRKHLHVQQDHRRTCSNGFEGLRPPGDGSWNQREPKNHKSSEPS